jgi:hypothetical protein
LTNPPTAAAGYFAAQTGEESVTGPDVELVPAWSFTATSTPRYEAVVAVVAGTPQRSSDIAPLSSIRYHRIRHPPPALDLVARSNKRECLQHALKLGTASATTYFAVNI